MKMGSRGYTISEEASVKKLVSPRKSRFLVSVCLSSLRKDFLLYLLWLGVDMFRLIYNVLTIISEGSNWIKVSEIMF